MIEAEGATLHLTPEQIRAAVKDGSDHPLSVALDAHRPEVISFKSGYLQLPKEMRQQFAIRKLSFLADTLERLLPAIIPETPEWIIMGSRLIQEFPGRPPYPRYQIMRMIVARYIVDAHPEGKGPISFYLESQEKLPPVATSDPQQAIERWWKIFKHKRAIGLCAGQEENKAYSEILSEIAENMGTGMAPLLGRVQLDLRRALCNNRNQT